MAGLTGNKPFYFSADPDNDPNPGIFKGIFTRAGINLRKQRFACAPGRVRPQLITVG